MSLYQNSQGEWGVRWREGGRHRSKLIGLKSDAQDFERRKVLSLRTGGTIVDDRLTLGAFLDEWWERKQRKLAVSTRHAYQYSLDNHIKGVIGGYRMSELTPSLFDRYLEEIEHHGNAQSRRAIFLLQGALKHAVREGYLLTNPVKEVEKPKQKRTRAIRALKPAEVEALRAELNLEGRTLVSVMAYAGLRPGEALALEWRDVGENTIIVDKSLSFGEVKSTKNEVHRSIDLLAPLARDLSEWKLSQRPGRLVFPRPDGRPWRKTDFHNWRGRVFRKAKEQAGMPDITPYYLRHAFATLLIYQGVKLPDLAEQVGDRMETVLKNYIHVVRGADSDTPAEDQIRAARRVA